MSCHLTSWVTAGLAPHPRSYFSPVVEQLSDDDGFARILLYQLSYVTCATFTGQASLMPRPELH